MKEVYADTAEAILRLRVHRDPLIRKTVITLIPTLALYDTQSFSELFMHRAMAHLLEQLQKSNERSFGMCRTCSSGHILKLMYSMI
jgi:FKBP12-rapamycin complex-associated protein